ncbi:hypothetical protein ANCCAN_20025 [Ancylostoma caninum]|uniref:Uncharacterized protein n=1 Tax=Ancylostoma caninum TaxID=29170 RepID=A0A368FPH8_ANCCA|nr:hypothetical protein ANCCAN_20025 [Ancylostoma caninum]
MPLLFHSGVTRCGFSKPTPQTAVTRGWSSSMETVTIPVISILEIASDDREESYDALGKTSYEESREASDDEAWKVVLPFSNWSNEITARSSLIS